MIRKGALLMLAVLATAETGTAGEPEIYRCVQDDGTVAFQQMPCRPVPVAKPDNRVAASAATSDETQTQAKTGDASRTPPVTNSVPPAAPEDDAERQAPESVSSSRADCEKSTRDAIDAIDAELQASSNPDNDRARLDELLDLTRRLRLCKQL